MTWSPGLTLVTPSPTSTTTPAPSWPRTAGKTPSGSSPESVKASVWQTPVCVIFTRTSPLRGGSTSISTISSGFPASNATAARDFMACSSMKAGGSAGDGPLRPTIRQSGIPGDAQGCPDTIGEYSTCAAARPRSGVRRMPDQDQCGRGAQPLHWARASAPSSIMAMPRKNIVIAVLVAVGLAFVGWRAWQQQAGAQDDGAFLASNGRIEATEIDIATKLAGRVAEILVHEGDFVRAGDLLARMQVDTLQAQLREAHAQRQQAINAVASARAQAAMRESDKAAMQAQVRRAEAELDAARRRQARSETLAREGATSAQVLDDDRAGGRSAEAALAAARAQVASADAAIAAAQAQLVSAQSQVEAIDATIQRIEAEIEDAQ